MRLANLGDGRKFGALSEAGPLLCTDHSLFQPYGSLEILQVLAAPTNGRRRAW